jgi:hypothetical protein
VDVIKDLINAHSDALLIPDDDGNFTVTAAILTRASVPLFETLA